MNAVLPERSIRKWLGLLGGFAVAFGGMACTSAGPTVDGISFAVAPGKLYVPLNEAGRMLHWSVRLDRRNDRVVLNRKSIPASSLRDLVDGTKLVSLTDLESVGASLLPDYEGQRVLVMGGSEDFTVIRGEKRAEISLPEQKLRAWQGRRLVLDCRISSGRHGSTPSGYFRAGPYKARMHYSSRYDNAPMPWSVQVHGHVFIHGFSSVPRYPASHGCIRLPLNEGNPARFFYEWIDRGTPVRVRRG